MSKRVFLNGKYYRMRRGKLVEIPAEWVGKITTRQTINRRKESARLKRKELTFQERKQSDIETSDEMDTPRTGTEPRCSTD